MRIAATSLLLLGLAACSSAPPPPAAAPAGGGKKVDAATAGSISGKVTFAGTPPKPEMLRINTDKACVAANGAPTTPSDAVLVSADGAVQNVFVYVKDGLDPVYSFDAPTKPVKLDQHGCRYAPRILGVRTGQEIHIVNSDATLHNVHALPMTNQEFNQGQAEQAADIVRTFTAPEVMVRFKCDVHGWMNAYAGVRSDPFFAVTGADGAFEIKGLPPGKYTLEAWHETFVAQTQSVTIGPSETKTAAFVMKEK